MGNMVKILLLERRSVVFEIPFSKIETAIFYRSMSAWLTSLETLDHSFQLPHILAYRLFGIVYIDDIISYRTLLGRHTVFFLRFTIS